MTFKPLQKGNLLLTHCHLQLAQHPPSALRKFPNLSFSVRVGSQHYMTGTRKVYLSQSRSYAKKVFTDEPAKIPSIQTSKKVVLNQSFEQGCRLLFLNKLDSGVLPEDFSGTSPDQFKDTMVQAAQNVSRTLEARQFDSLHGQLESDCLDRLEKAIRPLDSDASLRIDPADIFFSFITKSYAKEFTLVLIMFPGFTDIAKYLSQKRKIEGDFARQYSSGGEEAKAAFMQARQQLRRLEVDHDKLFGRGDVSVRNFTFRKDRGAWKIAGLNYVPNEKLPKWYRTMWKQLVAWCLFHSDTVTTTGLKASDPNRALGPVECLRIVYGFYLASFIGLIIFLKLCQLSIKIYEMETGKRVKVAAFQNLESEMKPKNV